MANNTNKALIVVKENEGSFEKKFNVQFNPSDYKLTFGNRSITKKDISSEEEKTIVDNPTKTLDLEFFFDTYEKGTSVKKLTDNFLETIKLKKEQNGIRYCEFVWGDFVFVGCVKSMSHKYSMFLKNGIPVRANISLSLDEYNKKATNKGNSGKSNNKKIKWKDLVKEKNVDNPRLLI